MGARKLNIVLALVALTLGFSLSVKAQADCVYGLRIYARGEAGKAIENAKIEVSGLSQKDKLPPNLVRIYFDRGSYFVGIVDYGSTLPGDYLLRVAAGSFESYERQFKFPVCEIQSFELKLQPKGSTAKAGWERLFTVHGKVFDEEMKPVGNAKIEAAFADGRVYQTSSNAYGFYEIGLPKGVATIRVTDSRIPEIVFRDFKIGKNHSVLNVPVCLKCKTETKN